MDATLGLAIWGAVTGTVATSGGIFALLRDRPRITATQEIEIPHSAEDGWDNAELVLVVVNTGRQPVTLLDAGFGLGFSEAGRWPRRHETAEVVIGEATGPDLPMRLEPGAPATWRLAVGSVMATTGPVAQGFAKHSQGRLRKGEPAFTRKLLTAATDGTMFGASASSDDS